MPTQQDVRKQVALAHEAVSNKKAEDVTLLQLPGDSSTFTDYFLICSGSNPRQVQAIADEVDERLSKDMGVEPNAREGYQTAEWILLDYVDFVVHIFNAQRRAYYDLERLWKSAHRLSAHELLQPQAAVAAEVAPAPVAPAKKRARKAAAKKAPSVRAAARQSVRGGAAKAPARKKAAKSPARKTAAKKSAGKAAKPIVAKKKVAAKKTAAKKLGPKRK